MVGCASPELHGGGFALTAAVGSGGVLRGGAGDARLALCECGLGAIELSNAGLCFIWPDIRTLGGGAGLSCTGVGGVGLGGVGSGGAG